MTTTLPTRFVPAGAVKVAHKLSDAVAYLYTNPQGRPTVVAYAGKSAKPAMWFQFSNEAAREKRVIAFFAARAASLAHKAERKAARNKPHQLQLGHVLVASWGYEQTNIDFFEVTKVVGPHTVEVRPIRSIIDPTLVDQGRALPKGGDYTGPATRHRVSNGDSVKIDDVRRASLWNGRPMSWSSYH